MKNYEEIINLLHYEPKYHPRMTVYNRSAQFAPFAALVGYSEAISEVSRPTENEISLDDDLKNFIDKKLRIVENHIKDNSIITVIYFEKDKRKEGGRYKEYKGIVKRIDLFEHLIVFKDKFKINLETILDINAEFIKEL